MELTLLFCCLLCLALISQSVGWRLFKSQRPSINRLSSTSNDQPTTINLKGQLTEDMKNAMRNKEKSRLAAVRSIINAVKQKEIDERIELTDDMIFTIISKLVKQRKESIKSYSDAGRQELVESEQEECNVISSYLPKQMSEEEIISLVNETTVRLGASTIKDMGKVMNEMKHLLAGKADTALVSEIIKKKLTGK